MNRFRIKTEVRFDTGALDSLKEYTGLNIAIITDPFMVTSGAAERIGSFMTRCKKVSIFGEVKPDPPIELIAQGLKFLQDEDADLVVALGGGSSIDAAKSMVLMARRAMNKQIPLVAIPTTSGTGSEVTSFAVVTDKAAGVKYPLVSEELLPDVAILDPELVKTAPPSVTADTGFDVITHALEAYVSTQANDFSDALAEKALEIAFRYLPLAFRDGMNLVARDKMHTASCLAGMAFDAVSLGINHGIAHALGAKFHIPHGRANAMLLPLVIAYNADVDGNFGKEDSRAAARYATIARKLGLHASTTREGVNSLVEEIRYMMRMTGTPMTLREAKVTDADLAREKESIIQSALKDPCTTTNPRKPVAEDVEGILAQLMA